MKSLRRIHKLRTSLLVLLTLWMTLMGPFQNLYAQEEELKPSASDPASAVDNVVKLGSPTKFSNEFEVTDEGDYAKLKASEMLER